MADLINLETGAVERVPEDRIAAGTHARPDERVNIVRGTETGTLLARDLPTELKRGFRVETTGESIQRFEEKQYADRPVAAMAAGGARGLTLGLSDVAWRAAGGDPEALRLLAQHNRLPTMAGEVGGAVGGALAVPFSPVGLAARGGMAAGRAVGGYAGAALGGALEGAAVGAGTGVSELALDDAPITAERVVSVVGSNALMGAGLGGVFGVSARALREATSAAKAKMSAKLGQAVAPEGEKLAQDMMSLRDDVSGINWKQAVSVGKKQLDNQVSPTMLSGINKLKRYANAPNLLAEKPWLAREALENIETGLSRVEAVAPRLRAGTQPGGYHHAALDQLPALKERVILLRESATAAEAAFRQGGQKGLAQSLVQGGTFGALVGPATGLLGPIIGPIAAAKGAQALADATLGGMATRLRGAAQGAANGVSKAINKALDVGEQAVKVAPVKLAGAMDTKFMARPEPARRPYAATSDKDVQSWRARERELASLTRVSPDGKIRMRPESRLALAERLDGVRAIAPWLATAMETTVARKVSYLAATMPKRKAPSAPDGPDYWRPSAAAIASFARRVEAAERPLKVFERLAAGNVTPEDAETIRAVYPEMYNEARQKVMMKLPTLQKRLPYKRRLSMSIMFNLPVDPAMEPNVLQVLQGSFVEEPDTAGGETPPMAKPQFGALGSAKKSSDTQPTPAQERAG